MTKQEFETKITLLGSEKPVSEDEFKIINFVYTFHPAISETEGKEQVAWLFINLGMRVFNDMTETAKRAEEIETQLNSLKGEMESYKAEYSQLKRGFIFPEKEAV